MTDWNRATEWRQGHVLTDQTVADLGLCDDQVPENALVVVISHDCDIANSTQVEPDIEVIIGTKVSTANGNLTHTKNPRKLHISFEGGERLCIAELVAIKKRLIQKHLLIAHPPSEDFRLNPKGIGVLQRWLAARYRRAAFPDAFERRIKANGLAEKLQKILKPSGKHIRTIFFDVDDGEEIMRQSPEDTYSLKVLVVYATDPSPQDAEAAAAGAKTELESAFKECFCDAKGKWRDIELVYCEVISDEALSYHQSQYFKEWRLEHFSLKEEPQHPTM